MALDGVGWDVVAVVLALPVWRTVPRAGGWSPGATFGAVKAIVALAAELAGVADQAVDVATWRLGLAYAAAAIVGATAGALVQRLLARASGPAAREERLGAER